MSDDDDDDDVGVVDEHDEGGVGMLSVKLFRPLVVVLAEFSRVKLLPVGLLLRLLLCSNVPPFVELLLFK